MKRIITIVCCLIAFSNFNNVHASFLLPDSTVHRETLKNLKVSEFVKLSSKELETITGKKFGLIDKISFSFTKMKMKKAIRRNPNLTVKEYFASSKKLGTGWIIVISAIGGILLFMVIIVIIFS
jgi:hypothetical protein